MSSTYQSKFIQSTKIVAEEYYKIDKRYKNWFKLDSNIYQQQESLEKFIEMISEIASFLLKHNSFSIPEHNNLLKIIFRDIENINKKIIECSAIPKNTICKKYYVAKSELGIFQLSSRRLDNYYFKPIDLLIHGQTDIIKEFQGKQDPLYVELILWKMFPYRLTKFITDENIAEAIDHNMKLSHERINYLKIIVDLLVESKIYERDEIDQCYIKFCRLIPSFTFSLENIHRKEPFWNYSLVRE